MTAVATTIKTQTPLFISDMPFGRLLLTEQQRAPAKRKGERKRQLLIASAATMLNDRSFHRVRVSDICEEADTSAASFYVYFDNKDAITLVVLEMFAHQVFNVMRQPNAPRGEALSDFEALYQANLRWLKIVHHNSGLMRCMLQVSYEDVGWAEIYNRLNLEYNQGLARIFAHKLGLDDADEKKLLLKVLALGSMTDDFTRRQLEAGGGPLRAVIADVCPSLESQATFLSELWYQPIFGTNP